MRPIQKILIELSTGKKYPIKEVDDDFHTSLGIISKKEVASGKSLVTSSKGQSFILLDPAFPDVAELIERGPQVMIHKDIGLIIAKTGINKDSVIVDAGGGSGMLSLSLANICKEITVYENNAEHSRILSKNIAMVGLKNIKLKQQDITKGIGEKEVNLITLDLPEPWKVTALAEKVLKVGGFLVVYLPNLLQVKEFIASTKNTAIKVLETIELLERKWKIDEKIMRPEFEMLGHTGFLTFTRKLG